MNNSRSDHFTAGSTGGREIEQMRVAAIKRLPSGDALGKTVGDVLPAKRLARGHRAQTLMMKYAPENVEPLTIKDGVLVDGHHRVAAAEDAGLRILPVRHAPTV